MTNKKNGFTLIELSIVLIIISLIVAGIVGGKALISSAKLNKVIRDFNAIQTALNSFYLEYDGYPGDLANAYDYFANGDDTICGGNNTSNSGCNGNGDNKIGYSGVYYTMYESIRAWRHLSLAKLLPVAENYGTNYTCLITSYSSGCGISSPNVMLSDFRNNTGYIFVHPATYADAAIPNFFGKTTAFIMLSYPDGGNGVTSSVGNMLGTTEGVMTPANAKSIDKKIDDGLPTKGELIGISTRTASSGNCTSPNITMSQIDSTAPSNTPYNLAETNNTCSILLNIGGN